MEQIICTVQDFSSQKTWYIFDPKPDAIQKPNPFFLRKTFPPKDLVYFCLKTRRHSSPFFLWKIFPPKDLVFFSTFFLNSANIFLPKEFLMVWWCGVSAFSGPV